MVTAIHEHGLSSSEERFLAFATYGDVSVLERLLADHLPQARAIAYRLLGSATDADDAIQEALVRLVKTAERYDGTVPFAAWLGQLVRGAALQLRRSAALRAGRERHPLLDREASAADSEPPGDELAAAIREAVAGLPERYRAPIELHYFAQLSQEQTALALGLKEDAVAQRMHRARERLREALRRHGIVLGVAALIATLEGRASAAEACAALPSLSPHQAASAAVQAAGSRTGRLAAILVGSAICCMICIGIVTWWPPSAPAPLPPPAVTPTVDAPTADPPRSRTWDFADGRTTGLTVTTGGWHPVIDDGIPCMETEGVRFRALIELDGLRPPLRLSLRCSPRGDPRNPGQRYRLRFDWTPYIEAAWLNDLDPEIVVEGPRPGTDFVPFYRQVQDLTRDALEIRVADRRSLLLFCTPGDDARLALDVVGRFRLSGLRIEEIGEADLADHSTYRRSVEAIAPELRHGTRPLDLRAPSTGQRPSVTFWRADRDGPFPEDP